MWKLSNVKLKNFLGLYTGHSIPDESTPRKNWKWTDQERSFAYMCNFEALRDEEDFVDVTLACDGQRLKAHKVVLSACSPYFKELFKSNPCKHPILFLRDVEFSHLQSLVEFMYAGEVNVAQAQLSSFLHTAESLQIRGLTEAPQRHKHLYRHQAPSEPSSPTASNQELSAPTCDRGVNPHRVKAGADDLDEEDEEEVLCLSPSLSPPPAKRACQDRGVREEGQEEEGSDHQTNSRQQTGLSYQHGILRHELEAYRDNPVEMLEPKLEIPDYASDGECKADNGGVTSSFLGLENSMDTNNSLSSLHGGMDVLPGTSAQNFMSDISQESSQADLRKLHSLDPRPCPICFRMYSNLSNLRQHVRLIHNPQTVACPLCNKPFKTKLYLKRHLMSFHELVCSSAATNGSPKSQGQQHPDLYPPPTPSQGFPGMNNNPLGGGEEKSSKFSAIPPHKTKETPGQAEEYFQNSRMYQIPLSSTLGHVIANAAINATSQRDAA
uniref:Broad-complex n=1 Tax=Timema douglasi TaxID=61478 RepID=A0A7R8VKN8_TIMDO|nr:unnamed protein product [Timema douglasi]